MEFVSYLVIGNAVSCTTFYSFSWNLWILLKVAGMLGYVDCMLHPTAPRDHVYGSQGDRQNCLWVTVLVIKPQRSTQIMLTLQLTRCSLSSSFWSKNQLL